MRFIKTPTVVEVLRLLYISLNRTPVPLERSASKGTFKVYNLASSRQAIVIKRGEILAHPKISDNNTTENPPKLLDQVRDKLSVKHYSIRNENTYVNRIKR